MKATINFNLMQDGEVALEETFQGIFHIDDIIDKEVTDERVVLGKIFKLTYSQEGIKSTLTVNLKDKTVLWESLNTLTFKEGLKKTIGYKTPAGIIDIDLETNHLSIKHLEDDKKLNVRIGYNLYQGDTKIENSMNFSITY